MNWRDLLAQINGSVWALDESRAALLESRVHRAKEDVCSAIPEVSSQPKPYRMVGSVAVISVVGLIMPKADFWFDPESETALDYLRSALRMALADSGVSAIALYVDSPGGSARGVDEMSTEIFAARGTKPIGAFADGLCASAAYYLASAVDPGNFWSTGTALVGSIGVISVHLDWSLLLKGAGITPTVFTFGARKGDGNPYEKLSTESRAAIQSRINDFGQMFEAAVARNRGVDAKEVRAKFGQGQVFVGQSAKQRGMIDAVGSWEQFVLHMAGGSQQKTKPNAGASAAAVSQPAAAAPATPQQSKGSKMNPKIKAALFARGMIESLEATDVECKAALAGFFRGAVPEGDKAVLEGLNGTATLATVAEPLKPAANVKEAHERELAEARAEAAEKAAKDATAKAHARMTNIQACGKQFGMSAEEIDAGIKSDKTLEQLVADWTAEKAKTETAVGRVTVTETGLQNFERDASAALQLRLGMTVEGAANNADSLRLRHAPMAELARMSLGAAGQRIDSYDREQVIRLALEHGGFGVQTIGADSGGPVNRPGLFPNILSNLFNKMLDDAIELAAPTYPEWTGVWPSDLPDFKPAPVVNKGQRDELDQMLDAEAFKQFGLGEELSSMMQLNSYGNKFGWTPVMLANDDLGAFQESLLGMGEALENTTNRLCLNLLTGNATILSDGVALYDDSAHANVIAAGGGAPSLTQWDLMVRKVRAQRGIGGTGYVRTPLAVVLVPPRHDVAATQTFSPMNGFGETKQPVTDSTLNVFRGKAKVVVEPELQASSSDIWYGFADPARRATVVRAYFRGFGRSGKRERWYDPNTRTTWMSLEHRVGAAVKNYRYTVRNPGT